MAATAEWSDGYDEDGEEKTCTVILDILDEGLSYTFYGTPEGVKDDLKILDLDGKLRILFDNCDAWEKGEISAD